MASSSSIRESKSRLAGMLDSITEGIYCVDLDGNCNYCNARCIEMLGFESESELTGKNIHDLIHHLHHAGTPDQGQDCKIYQSCSSGTKSHVNDEVFWRKDGSKFDVEYWTYPLFENDTRVGAFVRFSDITQTKAQNAERNRLARLVDTSHDAIISRDCNGVITSWNQGATEIYGYSADEAIGKTPSFILPDDADEEEPEVRSALQDGKELSQFIVKRRRKNDEPCDISVTISPLFDANGQLIGCSSIERDVTETRKSQDAVLRAMKQAQHAEKVASEASKSRTQFLANVSHELRTPMNAILGMINLSLDENLDPAVADNLKIAKNSADSLLELVNELLDFAKLESGKFEIANEPLDLREIIDIPCKVISNRASEKGLEIICEIDQKIPKLLTGDGRRIQQVLTNLLSNAVKFTDRGEVIARVELVRELPSEVRLRFSVTDTGVGISEKDQRNILLPFEQADMSSTRKHHGTGLGLSISRDLVALMGGKLKIESKIGEGSCFYFYLSLVVEDDSKPDDNVPKDIVKDMKVLIVDDNPTNLRILENIFVSWSMQPITSTSAAQALQVLDELKDQDQTVSIAIVDSLMPLVDGYELVERVADKTGDQCPPIVMMQSSADMGMYSNRSTNAPIAHYLTKPISQSELLNAVVDTLDLYQRMSPTQQRRHVTTEMEASTTTIRPLRVLLVEDLPANQLVAEVILTKRGHAVVKAANGRMAIDQLISDEIGFDVVLMDIQMPVMDGLQATAAIRELPQAEHAEISIIAMTAHAMQGDRESCLAAGMDAYISKPLDAERLVALVESIGTTTIDELRSSERTTAAANKPIQAEVLEDQIEALVKSDCNLVDYNSTIKRLGNDEELFAEFIEIFLEDAPGIMGKINTAVAVEDHVALEKAAHSLQGLMSNFGAETCCDLAIELETAGRLRESATMKTHRKQLAALFEQLCKELTAWQQSCSLGSAKPTRK
ncbi:MAG: response regulator [Planctomycetota bacterium]